MSMEASGAPVSRDAIVAALSADKDAHIAFLQALIQTPSPNPPGETGEVARVVANFLANHGINSDVVTPHSESPNLVSVFAGRRSAGDKTLVLNAHIDAFPVSDIDDWELPPYSGTVKDGYVHGRGAVDMKAGTAASVIAYSYLYKHQAHLSGRCALTVVSDEETGGKYGTRFLLHEDARKDVWRGSAVLNAEPTGLQSIRFGEKGTLRMTFNVNTPGGHGAYIHKDEGAVRIASRLIERLVGLEAMEYQLSAELESYLQRQDVRDTIEQIMGIGAAESMLRPTVNIGTIKGGDKVNMIPSKCTFEAEIRLPIGLTAEAVLTAIDDKVLANVPEASYAVQAAATNPSAASPIDHEMVGLIQKNAASDQIPLAIPSLGATDCKHFRYLGIPAFSYGPSPVSMAEKNERVSVAEFLETVRVHTLVGWEYLHGRESVRL